MKKSKVKQISYRTLVKQHEALKQQYTQKLDAISSLNNRISELCQGLREARGDLKVREQLDNRRIKAIGLYFAAVDSETSSVPESRDYLRHLRSEIFL